MKCKMFLAFALLCAFYVSARGQEFPIGIIFEGNQNAIDSVAAMGFTWVDAYCGDDLNSLRPHILQNNRNLKVIAHLVHNILNPSVAQRMFYQAELTDSQNGTENYFASHATGAPGTRLGTSVWLDSVNTHAAGFMRQSPVPDNQYFYERRNWVATANISIDLMGAPSDSVVRIEIAEGANILAQRIIRRNEFTSTAFHTFEVPYTLPLPVPPPPKYEFPVNIAQSAQDARHIDVRVYWYDKVNTYLDFVVLEDSVVHPNLNGAYQLFRGERDNDITTDAQHFASQATYPLVQRFYLNDEPNWNGYQSFNYVDQVIQSIPGGFEGSASGRGRSITATPNYVNDPNNVNASFNRFTSAADPYELYVDHYPITADVPADPAYIPANDASSAGIDTFTSVSNYNSLLQGQLNPLISASFLPAIQTAQAQNPAIPWWYIVQLHGVVDVASGQYRQCDANNTAWQRPPSPEEIRVMVNLALAYGAKGISYFWFHSSGDTDFGGCAEVRFPGLVVYGTESSVPDHSTDYDTFGSNTVFTGYQKKYDAVKAINANLQTLGPTLVNLTWRAGHSIHLNTNEPINSTYKLYDVTAKVVGGAADPESDTYVEVGILQNGAVNHYMVVNRRCHSSETREITLTLQGNSNYAYRITDVATGATTTCYLGSGITTFPYTLVLGPGEGKLLKLEDIGAWSSTISSNTTWSGNYSINANVTVNNNVTLTVSPGANVQFGSAKSLTINGKLVVDSNDPNNRITFSGASSTPSFWNGIKINSGSSTNVSTLRRCNVQYATTGITVTYTGTQNLVTIDRCRISNNSSNGIYVNGNAYSGAFVHPIISKNHVHHNSSGGISTTNYGKPTITQNQIEYNSAYGVSVATSYTGTISLNRIANNNSNGLLCTYSSHAQLHLNTIEANGAGGVYCLFNSNVTAYGFGNSYGRNEITGNTGTGIYSNSSSPRSGFLPMAIVGFRTIRIMRRSRWAAAK